MGVQLQAWFLCMGRVAELETLLLQREIPMAWGTTIDSLTPEINPFLYTREIKQLTLKDIDLYLIPDG